MSYLAGNKAVDLLGPDDFSLLLAEARASGLLGRLAQMVTKSPTFHLLSPHQRDQLFAATIHAAGFRRDVQRELTHIERALSGLDTPVILLKGACYVLLNLPAADGRIFSDADILVEKACIGAAEAALMLGGWATGALDAYDHRYYRQWSHEIPPMTHLHRGTTIDLHHSLVMPTCRVRVDTKRMIAAAVPVSDGGFWWRLRDEDLVLHAVSHLMLNSEFDRGLRDLWDIDLLYRHFSEADPGFLGSLFSRAQEVGLETLLNQVVWLMSTVFGTPLPACAPPMRNGPLLWLVARSASTRHPASSPTAQTGADLALMLREMYLRLPAKLLAVHLWHKTSDLFTTQKKPLAV
ncbi:MAG: nucleotidyltransferase family protein [Rhodoferax sp.]|nr:nucleotidyltransferase family protein [Rhodoferax sp.]MBK9234631.1 nucleotidyltransferase family protein [Rhodoferax sp.]